LSCCVRGLCYATEGKAAFRAEEEIVASASHRRYLWLMELDQLRYFLAVARAGTFTRAAEREGVTQPSLSQQVRKLENSLGVALFERRGRSVRLTQAGERLLPQAQSLLRQAADARQSLGEFMNRVGGRLAVGAIPTVMPYWLAPQIAGFQSRYANVELHLVENVTARLVEGLQTGDLDVAIISLPLSSPDIVCSELFREEIFFVLPEAHSLAALPLIDPRRTSSERLLILREGHCFRRDTLAVSRRTLRGPGTVFETDQFSSVFALVAIGFGISVAPKMAIAAATGCRCVTIDGHPSRRIGYAQISRPQVPPAQRAFINWLKELSHRQPADRSRKRG
jgi:LysR family hydrogen peroxide-inducible transcriptional activator